MKENNYKKQSSEYNTGKNFLNQKFKPVTEEKHIEFVSFESNQAIKEDLDRQIKLEEKEELQQLEDIDNNSSTVSFVSSTVEKDTSKESYDRLRAQLSSSDDSLDHNTTSIKSGSDLDLEGDSEMSSDLTKDSSIEASDQSSFYADRMYHRRILWNKVELEFPLDLVQYLMPTFLISTILGIILGIGMSL